MENDHFNYTRIAAAIQYIRANFKEQPNLDDVAREISLSPFHFQRIFREWAGISPKKFLQYTSLEHAKKLLRENQATLSETAYETGLSGTGRLHDLFINMEGLTPANYKNGGKNLAINYSFSHSPFGDVIIASTTVGICYLSFVEDRLHAFSQLQQHFPNAVFLHQSDEMQQNALYIFAHDWSKLNQIKLHLKGTDFQMKVWHALLKIPYGQVTTYGQVAKIIGRPNASRAVGTAIGNNPVAFLIPCHRVIQSSGEAGGYMWGTTRKSAIIGWESAHAFTEEM